MSEKLSTSHGDSEFPPTWDIPIQALSVLIYRPNRRRVGLIAGVVGTLLVGINQGSVLVSDHLSWLVWARVVSDYLIPTIVSSLGLLAGSHRATIKNGSHEPNT